MGNLTAIRKGLGLTQAAMAPILGVTPGMVWQYENRLVDLPASKARMLREYAARVGQVVTFDDIYGTQPATEVAA